MHNTTQHNTTQHNTYTNTTHTHTHIQLRNRIAQSSQRSQTFPLHISRRFPQTRLRRVFKRIQTFANAHRFITVHVIVQKQAFEVLASLTTYGFEHAYVTHCLVTQRIEKNCNVAYAHVRDVALRLLREEYEKRLEV